MSMSARRGQRAQAARLLLSMDQRSELRSAAAWQWHRLDALPAWALLDQRDRQLLQRLCGAMLLAPLLRLWIDSMKIRALCALVGEQRFAAIVDGAPPIPDESRLNAAFDSLERWMMTMGENQVERCLASAGARVLRDSIEDPGMREQLLSVLQQDVQYGSELKQPASRADVEFTAHPVRRESVGESALPLYVARALLAQASRLAGDTQGVAKPVDSL